MTFFDQNLIIKSIFTFLTPKYHQKFCVTSQIGLCYTPLINLLSNYNSYLPIAKGINVFMPFSRSLVTYV